jgi:hypothetical protein
VRIWVVDGDAGTTASDVTTPVPHSTDDRRSAREPGSGQVSAGITSHIWSIVEIVGLLDAAEKKAA